MGFFAPTNNDFPDFEGKHTDLFVPNGTHAKKAKFFVARIGRAGLPVPKRSEGM